MATQLFTITARGADPEVPHLGDPSEDGNVVIFKGKVTYYFAINKAMELAGQADEVFVHLGHSDGRVCGHYTRGGFFCD